MKLQSKKRTFFNKFFNPIFIPSHSAEFEINFIETFDENYMLEVIQELKYENNIKRIKNFLDQSTGLKDMKSKKLFQTLIHKHLFKKTYFCLEQR